MLSVGNILLNHFCVDLYFELIMVLFVFIPLALRLVISATDNGGIIRDIVGDTEAEGFTIVVMLVAALFVTMIFFGFVQLAMLGGLYIFGKIISTAQAWTGSSVFASGVYWCAAKSAEHSVTERVLRVVRRL